MPSMQIQKARRIRKNLFMDEAEEEKEVHQE